MQTLEPILKELEFFKDLSTAHLELLVGCAANVRFEAESLIASEGQPAEHFYIIRHGLVAIDVHDHRRGYVRLMTLHEGDILGWSWLFPPYKWHFDVRAITLTRAIRLDGVCVRNKCGQDHTLGYEFMQRFAGVVIHRLEMMRLQVLDVYA